MRCRAALRLSFSIPSARPARGLVVPLHLDQALDQPGAVTAGDVGFLFAHGKNLVVAARILKRSDQPVSDALGAGIFGEKGSSSFTGDFAR